jgi:hypothetical protein
MVHVFLVLAQVYPAQGSRVIVHSHIFPVSAPALPAPSLGFFGNYHTVRRSFSNLEQAKNFAVYLRSTFAQGPRHNPILDGGQIELF